MQSLVFRRVAETLLHSRLAILLPLLSLWQSQIQYVDKCKAQFLSLRRLLHG